MGPTGLSLAWLLGNGNVKNKIVLYEKGSVVGGTWAAKWKQIGDKYLFTHHSPQIIASYVNTFKLWKDMGIDKTDFLIKYDDGIGSLILNNTTLFDKFHLLVGYMYYILTPRLAKKKTIKNFFNLTLSTKGWNTIYHFCYLTDGVPPSIMTLYEFYGLFDVTALNEIFEMSKPSDDGFAKYWVNKLKETGNVSFKYNTKLNKIDNDKEGLKFQIEFDGKSEDIKVLDGDKLILSTDPKSLLSILSNSDENIKNNWGKWNVIQKQIGFGIYVSLSVQYHFQSGTTFKLPYPLKAGFGTDWDIICIKLPFLDVLSCSVINQDAYSKVLKKPVKECNPEEVKLEVWRQLQQQVKLPNYTQVTIGKGTTWIEGKGWEFDISSSARTTMGPLEPVGNIRNLAIVNSMNPRDYPATTMESAVESALRFTDNKVLKPRKLSTYVKLISVFLILLGIGIITKMLKCF